MLLYRAKDFSTCYAVLLRGGRARTADLKWPKGYSIPYGSMWKQGSAFSWCNLQRIHPCNSKCKWGLDRYCLGSVVRASRGPPLFWGWHFAGPVDCKVPWHWHSGTRLSFRHAKLKYCIFFSFFLLKLQELMNADLIPPNMQTKYLLTFLMIPLGELAKSDSNVQ